MKKLRPENYKHLLKVQNNIYNYACKATEDADRAKAIAESSDAFWRKDIALNHRLSHELIKLLLSENEEQFKSNLAVFRDEFDEQDLEPWFNTHADMYLELFELVEIDEAESGTTTKTSEI
jgi:diketogulonate reductase-like aldo/keto reductase